MKFTDEAMQHVQEIWEGYLRQPFVSGIGDGSLNIDKFRYYMIQDYIYLHDYIKVFALGLAKSTNLEDMRGFNDSIATTLTEIQDVHIPYMERLGITDEDIKNAKVSLTNLSYTKYMLAEVYEGDALDAYVAVLSCSWSYAYIAKSLYEQNPSCKEHEFYGQWIEGYISESFQGGAKFLIDKVNKMTENISQEKWNHLQEVFYNCCLLEKNFWDMAYNMN